MKTKNLLKIITLCFIAANMLQSCNRNKNEEKTTFVFQGSKFSDFPKDADLRYTGDGNERTAYMLDSYYTGDTVLTGGSRDSALLWFKNHHFGFFMSLYDTTFTFDDFENLTNDDILSGFKRCYSEKYFELKNRYTRFQLSDSVKERCNQYCNIITEAFKYLNINENLDSIYNDSEILWRFHIIVAENKEDKYYSPVSPPLYGDDKISILEYKIENFDYKPIMNKISEKFHEYDVGEIRGDGFTKIRKNLILLNYNNLKEILAFTPYSENARKACEITKIILDNYKILLNKYNITDNK